MLKKFQWSNWLWTLRTGAESPEECYKELPLQPHGLCDTCAFAGYLPCLPSLLHRETRFWYFTPWSKKAQHTQPVTLCLNILNLLTKSTKKLSAENLPGRHASEMSFRSICTCPLKAFVHTYGAIYIAILFSLFSLSLDDMKHFTALTHIYRGRNSILKAVFTLSQLPKQLLLFCKCKDV